MAVYIPPNVWEKAVEVCRILKSEDKDGFTNYVIEVRIPPFKWQVIRRYRQFVELHEKMIKNFSVNKNLLPPKKLLGNRSESFIMERQKALEHYLRTLLHRFILLPEPLALFLDFQKYEIRAMTSVLSEILFNEGDEIINKAEPYEFNPLQLHAISERLKLGDPTFYSNNPRQDIAHLVEFITQLKHLKIVGSFKYFEASNIIPNYLSYDLSMFKFLETIEILNGKLENNLISVEALRSRLKSLKIHQSLSDLSTFLLCEILHWCPVMVPVQNWPFWKCVTYANFSHNSLRKIHPCIKLLSSVDKIDLSHNEIEVVENMETLSKLSVLVLSHNKIQDLEHLHTRLGNIHSLNLASNRIKYLHGLSKLFSVSELYLENNLISSMAEAANLSKLPCLEILNLQNNPVTFTVDYRPQLLLKLGSLAPEITLDGIKATEKEIDTVSVLQALKIARDEPTSAQKLVHEENLSTEFNFSVKTTCLPVNKFQEPDADHKSNTEYAIKKTTSNLHDVSKFRQQIETLRRIGGSDWLRLLNEMHCPSSKTASLVSRENHNRSDASVSDTQLHNVFSFDKNLDKLTPELIKTSTVSFEMAYPECMIFLDSSNDIFKEQFLTPPVQNRILNDMGKNSAKIICEAKVLWVVALQYNESSVYETAVCLVLLPTEIVFLKLKKITLESHEEMSCVSKFKPELIFSRSVLPQDILSLNIGPCNAYIELKIKDNCRLENLTILTMDKDATCLFHLECFRLYNIEPVYKLNPFANNVFDINLVDSSLSLSKISVEKQIIFSQRVCVSKTFHKCQHGILHYIFVTPSHVVLVEERLNYSQLVGLDITMKPQFQICALVNVHTNIKQIHLKDIDFESGIEMQDNVCFEQASRNDHSLPENEELHILYKCGSWLIMEFESSVLLYLNFFTLKQRTEFLDVFLSTRSQR
ncbi:nischarin [Trichonephila clavata]|uniref:Nischarin n=1 Tax=Trichonephila clavata TaxID=2740835 RepID=A0A8X6G115_TRICU|nr:nischarin [Trichonephila clavata]